MVGPVERESARDFGRVDSCCAPKSSQGRPVRPAEKWAGAGRSRHLRSEAVQIPGGRAEIGTDKPVLQADGEAPRRYLTVRPFAIDVVTVTNERFAAFVQETGYVTDAERLGWSFVFYQHLGSQVDQYPRVQNAEWWRRVSGAFWAAPEGVDSNISERLDHPVVHVSHADAQRFAAWSGGRLPSEAEWEHAARGGLQGALFPWGNQEPDDQAFFPCNIWQGDFPSRNTCADGHFSTAPARSFAPNGYGLYNCSGNVWEWCANAYRVSSLKQAAQLTNAVALRDGWRVLKGGSFLCHRSYCYRYRIAARTGNAPDTSTSHIGFRVAYDL